MRNPVIIIKSDIFSLFARRQEARNSFNMTLWNANYMGLIHVYVAYNLYNNAMVFRCGFVFIEQQQLWPLIQPLTSLHHHSIGINSIFTKLILLELSFYFVFLWGRNADKQWNITFECLQKMIQLMMYILFCQYD